MNSLIAHLFHEILTRILLTHRNRHKVVFGKTLVSTDHFQVHPLVIVCPHIGLPFSFCHLFLLTTCLINILCIWSIHLHYQSSIQDNDID